VVQASSVTRLMAGRVPITVCLSLTVHILYYERHVWKTIECTVDSELVLTSVALAVEAVTSAHGHHYIKVSLRRLL
jgi:hypothetical protein